MALWDKMLGKPLAWLLELVVKHLNLPLTVETIKSPPDVMITTKPGGAAPIIKREQPKSPTSCWTLVVLHDNGEQYYQNLLLKSFRSRVVIKLPGNIEMKLVEPPYSISQKKKNAIGQATVRVKDVVHIDAPHLEAIAMCFEAVPNSATQGFTQRLRAAYPYITKLAALPPYTPERGVSLSQQLTKPTTASKRQGCSNWPCRAGHCSNEDCPNYCFDSDCMIEMIDDNGEIVGVKSASQIRVGDCVRGIWADGTYSNTTVVVGVVKELVGRSVGMVEVSPGNFLTPGHPLQTSAGGLFVRPKQISPLQHKHVVQLRAERKGRSNVAHYCCCLNKLFFFFFSPLRGLLQPGPILPWGGRGRQLFRHFTCDSTVLATSAVALHHQKQHAHLKPDKPKQQKKKRDFLVSLDVQIHVNVFY